MIRKFWNGLDKTARGNCLCLCIAMAILLTIAFKNQNACRISDVQAKSSHGVRGFMMQHMFPCDASGRTPFRAPAELSSILGSDVPAPRNMGTLPPGARYKQQQMQRELQQY